MPSGAARSAATAAAAPFALTRFWGSERGFGSMRNEDGIVVVGLIPFLLDESILDTALETSRS